MLQKLYMKRLKRKESKFAIRCLSIWVSLTTIIINIVLIFRYNKRILLDSIYSLISCIIKNSNIISVKIKSFFFLNTQVKIASKRSFLVKTNIPIFFSLYFIYAYEITCKEKKQNLNQFNGLNDAVIIFFLFLKIIDSLHW